MIWVSIFSRKFVFPFFFPRPGGRGRETKKKGGGNTQDAREGLEPKGDTRRKELFKRGEPFIYDGSVDRKWPELKKLAEEHSFNWLLIDFDLSKQRIMKNKEMFDHIEPNEMFDR